MKGFLLNKFSWEIDISGCNDQNVMIPTQGRRDPLLRVGRKDPYVLVVIVWNFDFSAKLILQKNLYLKLICIYFILYKLCWEIDGLGRKGSLIWHILGYISKSRAQIKKSF